MCNGKRTNRSTSRTTPRGSAKERGPGSFRLPIRRTLAVKRKGRQVFRAPLKVRQYATFIANAICRIRRNNDETTLRSAKKALDVSWCHVHGKYGEGRRKKVDYPRDRTIEGGDGHRGGRRRATRMVVLCKGRSLINHGGGQWVESVARVSRSEVIEGEEREGDDKYCFCHDPWNVRGQSGRSLSEPERGGEGKEKSFEAVGTCFMEDRFYAPAFVLRFISLAAFDFGHLETWRAPLRRRDRFRIGWWSRGCFARVKKGRIWCAF